MIRVPSFVIPILTAVLMIASAPGVAAQGQPPTPVRVDVVTIEETAHHRMVTGELRASMRSLVSTREPGIVTELPIDEGQFVEQGRTLARLDGALLQLQLEQLQADRKVAEATREERRASLEKLEKEQQRILASYERGASYPKELEDIESDVLVAKARLQSAANSIDVIDARRRLLERQIEDMVIEAPFSGFIIAKEIEVGEWAGEGDAIAELVATDRIEAWLSVPQEHYGILSQPGHSIEIRIEASGETLRSEEYRILPQVDPRARSFTLIAMLSNEDHALAPGMSVVAWAPTMRRAAMQTAPKSGLNESEAGPFVFVVRGTPEAGLTAMPARVEVLFPLGDRFVIRAADLAEGDRIIIEGNERLMPGAPVSIIETATEPDDVQEGGRP